MGSRSPFPALALATLMIAAAQPALAQSAASRDDLRRDERATAMMGNGAFMEVHLAGNLPMTGKFLVPIGTRVDDLIFSIAMPLKKPEVLAENQFDLRNVLINPETPAERSVDLIAYNVGGSLDANPPLRDGDVVRVLRRTPDQPVVSISGAVRNPVILPFREGDTPETLLRIAGGRTQEADGSQIRVIRRASGSNGSDGPDAIALSDDQSPRFPLRPHDGVVIPVDRDRMVVQHVEVRGEVSNPGFYPIIRDRTTLADLLATAGGATPMARLHSARILRLPPMKIWRGLDVNPELDLPPIARLSDQYIEGFELLARESVLDRFVIHVDLRDEAASAGLVLLEGDLVMIDRDEATVQMMGQVSRNGFIPYEKGSTATDYINRAGGFGPAADTSRIYVIKAGAQSWVRPDETVIESGDVIFVDRHPLVSYSEERAADLTEKTILLQEQTLKLESRRSRSQLIFTAIGTGLSFVTTYILIRQN